MHRLLHSTSIILALLAVPISATIAFSPIVASTTVSSATRLLDTTNVRLLKTLRGGDQTTVEDKPVSSPKVSMITAPLMTWLTTASKLYSEQLEKSPIVTKSLTAGAIFALSDYLAQKIEQTDKKEAFNWKRFIAGTLVGLLYFGPAAHFWYSMIFKLIPGTSLLSTLHKALWGQAIFGPCFTCVFFATSLLQAGTFSLRNWGAKIAADLPGAWIAGIGYWPIVDFISYSVIPVQYIPLFVNLCSLVWTIYLSIVSNRSRSKAS